MAEYSGNSNKMRDGETATQERNVEPVISGSATIKKQTGFSKFASNIFVEDLRSVGSYILTDVLLPTFKKLISDSVTNGIDMFLYGKTGVSKQQSSGVPKISYGSYYPTNRVAVSSSATKPEPVSTRAANWDSIIFETRGDAESVLEEMRDMLDHDIIVTVSDLYELAKLGTPHYTLNKYGWSKPSDLKNAKVTLYRGQYMLTLPPPEMI